MSSGKAHCSPKVERPSQLCRVKNDPLFLQKAVEDSPSKSSKQHLTFSSYLVSPHLSFSTVYIPI